MNVLISLSQSQIGNETIETVNARDLHEFLESPTRFNDWMAAKIKDFGFTLDLDFATFTENPVKGRPTKEYFLTLDMAKELSMVERNAKGKQARQYFIECEKQLKAPQTDFLENPAKLRALLLDNVEKVMALEADNAEMAPKVAAYEHLTRSDGSFCITDAGKALGMRPKDTFLWLNAIKWIYRRAGNAHWVGYQDKIQNGFLDHKVSEVTRSDGSTKITEQVRVTAKGMARLAELYEKAAA